MRKYGRTWDAVPVPHIKAADLDTVSFREFRKKSLVRQRLSEEDLDITDEQLLENLKLTADGGYLKRAAVLVFHEDPEKWVTGAYVKIGYFRSDDDLVYQDEVHGSLIAMPDKVVDIIYDKYFKGIISYEGLQRVETYLANKDALREAVLNAIVHKDYATGIPIQIRVYDNKVTIFNAGALPANWTLQHLLTTHTSMPHNPDIANAFFKSGMTEAWGRGIEKIINSNVGAGKPKPEFEIIGEDSGFRVTFYGDANITVNDTANITVKIKLNKTQNKIIALMAKKPSVTAEMLSAEIGITVRNIKANIKNLKEAGLIDRVGADKNGDWVVKTGGVD
jgi:ATP-dependent DNA helicase RecG